MDECLEQLLQELEEEALVARVNDVLRTCDLPLLLELFGEIRTRPRAHSLGALFSEYMSRRGTPRRHDGPSVLCSSSFVIDSRLPKPSIVPADYYDHLRDRGRIFLKRLITDSAQGDPRQSHLHKWLENARGFFGLISCFGVAQGNPWRFDGVEGSDFIDEGIWQRPLLRIVLDLGALYLPAPTLPLEWVAQYTSIQVKSRARRTRHGEIVFGERASEILWEQHDSGAAARKLSALAARLPSQSDRAAQEPEDRLQQDDQGQDETNESGSKSGCRGKNGSHGTDMVDACLEWFEREHPDKFADAANWKTAGVIKLISAECPCFDDSKLSDDSLRSTVSRKLNDRRRTLEGPSK